MKKSINISLTPNSNISNIDKTSKTCIPSGRQTIRDCCKLVESKIDKPISHKHEFTSKLTTYNSIQLEKDIIPKKNQSLNGEISKLNQVYIDIRAELDNMRMQFETQIHELKSSDTKINKKVSQVNQQNSLRYCELMKNHLNLQKLMLRQIQQFKKNSNGEFEVQKRSLLYNEEKKQPVYIKNQIDLQIGQLRQSISNLHHEIKQCMDEINNKPSFIDIQNVFNQIKEKISSVTMSNQQIHTFVCELKDQNDDISNKIKSMQDIIAKLNEHMHQISQQVKQNTGQMIQSLEDDLQQKLSKIISSYNQNFSEIQQNTAQLKEMVSQILSINSLLSQKLINFITNKLDLGTFQSTIVDINAKIEQTAHMSNKKINEIDEKEFEFKHELRSLKQILDTLKKDYQRNYHKIQSNHSRIQSDVKSISNSRILKQNNFLPEFQSPKNNDALYQFVRFRKNQQSQNKRSLSSRRDQRAHIRKSQQSDLIGRDEYKNNLADELAEFGF